MTNTRITDPEIMERRYPVILREFSLRAGSGGKGRFTGGEGVIREIEFLDELQLSILSERRVFKPYGCYGGNSGSEGRNLILRKAKDGQFRVINMGGKNSTMVKRGDRFRIETPGGGGWGSPESVKRKNENDEDRGSSNSFKFVKIAGGSLGNYIENQNSA